MVDQSTLSMTVPYAPGRLCRSAGLGLCTVARASQRPDTRNMRPRAAAAPLW